MLAQEHVTFQGDVLLYGDNTEFRNAFREGETILGTAVRAAAVFAITERVRVAVGAFGNVRFGGDDAFAMARPIVSLTILGRRSSFVFGTFPPARVGDPPGPDRTGPHGLLPPLQRETLAFDRPYEAGLAWTFNGDAWKHEMWIDWQRVNTPHHRERFDGGATGEVKVSPVVFMPVELHIVHEGGQLYASGPVADSAAIALGLGVRGRLGAARSRGDRGARPRVQIRPGSNRPVGESRWRGLLQPRVSRAGRMARASDRLARP
jgi:hypothetical protein